MNEGSILLDLPAKELPDRLPVIPVAGNVVFPQVLLPLAVTEDAVASLVTRAAEGDRMVALVTVRPGRDPAEHDAGDPPFFDVGTLGLVLQHVSMPDSSTRVLIQGRGRLRARAFRHEETGWYIEPENIDPDPDADSGADGENRLKALHRIVLGQFQEIVSRTPQAPEEIGQLLARIDDPGHLADFICANLNLEVERKQQLLEETSVAARLEQLAGILGEEQKVLEYGTEIRKRITEEVEKSQKEVWLREQMRVIRKELGEDEQSETDRLRTQLETAGMPQEAREHADRELARLEMTSPQAPDYHMLRNYLDWMVALPWSAQNDETIDLDRAREVLDRDHYDREETKERIIEFLAVRKLKPDQQGPILCFVGPPGVGKTSLGRSIAESIGRAFYRMSLGGIHDEAEIRGHRRTYVGALPGRIVRGMRQVAVRNPVFMLDEIDKVGQDFRGDPTSALLEVLDPAQNFSFSDHYLEVPFDLSRVTFIATANTLASIPPALRDRLEIIELGGYTMLEKAEIGRRHLIPRQLEAAGLGPDDVRIEDDALDRLVDDYTREAGVRELERQIARVMRRVALQRVQGRDDGPVTIRRDGLEEFAGKRRFEKELAGRADEVGTATALAYTPEGGQILFVEAVCLPGDGKVRLTGQLGDVMKESAQTALSYVRSRAGALGIDDDRFQGQDVHVHVPAGAAPKDGPSAGVALVVALASLFSDRAVRSDVAVTGEVTLRGRVLPVGGIKEKLVAASQAGIRTVLLPRRNEADLDDLPDEVRNSIDLVLIDDVAEALHHAILDGDTPDRDRSRAR